MDINEIRQKIDSLDDKLLEMFLERMNLSEEIGRYKAENSLSVNAPAREREILARVQERSGENELYAYSFFEDMFRLSKLRQREILKEKTDISALAKKAVANGGEVFPKTGSVACQGVEGSNSQAACEKLVPRGNMMFMKSFESVCSAVEAGLCRYGVLPIENSTNGSVRSVYELLLHKNLYIVRSTRVCIRHELLAKKGTSITDIKKIYSHEQAIGQCSKFLEKLGDDVRIIPCANTALAAKTVSEDGDKTTAAISSHACSDIYSLETINDDILNSDNNYTRFICISKKPEIYDGADKISLIIACDNKPGALCELLSLFSVLGINMRKLESCPVSGRDFEFIFFLELDAGVKEKAVIPMLEELERTARSFVFLGCYGEA